MNSIEWSKKQEKIFSDNRFGVSEKEYKSHTGHYLSLVRRDTGIKKKHSVICLGCNDGAHVQAFFEAGYDAFGVDLQKVIEKSRGMRPSIANRLISCNLETDDIPHKRYWKLIFAKSIIEHLTVWEDMPFKMFVSQPEGGMVWLSTKNGDVEEKVEKEHHIHIPWDVLEYIFKKVGYIIIKHYKDPLSKKGQVLVAKKV